MTEGPQDALYREVVLDHHRHPRGARPLERFDVQASGKNPSCGDEVTLQVAFDGDRIAAVGVLSQGCAISTSSGSMMAELVVGRTVEEAAQVAERFKKVMHGDDVPAEVDLGDLEALTGVRKFPVRVKCALLPWITLLDAILARRQGRAASDRVMDVTFEERS
ncbi:MAG TPA: SUF system NifU family Fe-S cluster assembly protein [Candidatus Krumholzibacteria bacterium]|nr:SUF system NifU family Fe-S cluster assembly protein [Candidatus Krumholzibacteria bacterium]HPD71177.1 SUF system NifU family Fe-S cluster assembly protein [Candidatus Krumholzibacteria bacterium]HRY39123.1 SUF system NifU family Fe-S cluster assembly protein [Candidatus Krumholzibacteria bacterium]